MRINGVTVRVVADGPEQAVVDAVRVVWHAFAAARADLGSPDHLVQSITLRHEPGYGWHAIAEGRPEPTALDADRR